MSDPKNWVERRARRDKVLGTQSRATWEALCEAIMDARDSFNVNYPDMVHNPPVECAHINDKRVKITCARVPRTDGTGLFTSSILVVFEQNEGSIAAVAEDRQPLLFTISANEERAFLTHSGQEIGADEASQLILEPVFFPPGVKRSPRLFR